MAFRTYGSGEIASLKKLQSFLETKNIVASLEEIWIAWRQTSESRSASFLDVPDPLVHKEDCDEDDYDSMLLDDFMGKLHFPHD